VTPSASGKVATCGWKYFRAGQRDVAFTTNIGQDPDIPSRALSSGIVAAVYRLVPASVHCARLGQSKQCLQRVGIACKKKITQSTELFLIAFNSLTNAARLLKHTSRHISGELLAMRVKSRKPVPAKRKNSSASALP
jgi:hypothetical protein